MKTMEEYHAELDRRVESKRIGLGKRRRAARAALAGLAAYVWYLRKQGFGDEEPEAPDDADEPETVSGEPVDDRDEPDDK